MPVREGATIPLALLRENSVSAEEPGHSPSKTGLQPETAATVPSTTGLVKNALQLEHSRVGPIATFDDGL
jgi:hypothetical protein